MLVNFDQLPQDAKIWIYQANRKITGDEEKIMSEEVGQFLSEWEAHGNPLKSSFLFSSHYFLIIGVDEAMNKASGCSIDKSVKMVQELEKEHDISFLDRSNVAFMEKNGKEGHIKVIPIGEIKNKIFNREISEDAFLFNNLVNTKNELEKNWIIPAKEGWTKKYFNKVN